MLPIWGFHEVLSFYLSVLDASERYLLYSVLCLPVAKIYFVAFSLVFSDSQCLDFDNETQLSAQLHLAAGTAPPASRGWCKPLGKPMWQTSVLHVPLLAHAHARTYTHKRKPAKQRMHGEVAGETPPPRHHPTRTCTARAPGIQATQAIMLFACLHIIQHLAYYLCISCLLFCILFDILFYIFCIFIFICISFYSSDDYCLVPHDRAQFTNQNLHPSLPSFVLSQVAPGKSADSFRISKALSTQYRPLG
jgi:hypothetical protein